MVKADKLSTELRLIVGYTVDRIGLIIWPDGGAPEETDVRLYLELSRLDKAPIDVAIGTSSDGQTPVIEFDHVDGGKFLSELESRRLEWASDRFWKHQDSILSELFFAPVGANCELSAFYRQKIQRVFIVCFTDEDELPTGVVLEFENGRRIWSIASAYGNAVKTEEPDDWWPDPIRLKEVS